MEFQNIGELVRKMESDDKAGLTTISKYVSLNMRENLETIDAYLNSKHISGLTDSQGREKPFFNIVVAAVNIWFRATDLDRKHLKIRATKQEHTVLSFLATILLQNWMRKNAFGRFLNDWGLSLARYGSSILKFIEKGKKLYSEVMPWNRMIVDSVDFENNVKIEKLWLTPAQLLKRKEYDQIYVKKLIEARETRKTPDGQNKDTKDEYIPVYEIHGELPLAYLTDKDEDKDTYVQQMHVVSFVEKKDDSKDKFEDYCLIQGKEAKDPYLLTHLIKEDGRTQSIGAVEHLFEAQWMTNHTIKQIKDQLDLSSKLIFQTADGKFVGANVLDSIENGDILIHEPNMPLTAIYNKADVVALQNHAAQWKVQANEITGVSEAMLGKAPKAGTPWRQTEALLSESYNLFEIMTENKSLYLEEMLTKYIIPHLKKQMDTSEEISDILTEYQINQIDSIFVPNEAIKKVNQKIKNTALSGKMFSREQQDQEIQIETDNLRKMLTQMGNQRFIKPSDIPTATWKEVMKDLEWELEYDITGEIKDIQSVMTTLTTVLQTIAGNPMILQDPNMRLLFNRILESTGAISPIELNQIKQQMVQQPAMPIGGQGSVAGMPQLAPV